MIIIGKWVKELPAKKLLRRIEGHGEACNKEVGEGKADQEVVVDAPQLPVEEHAGDHQQVGEDRHQDDREEDNYLANVRDSDLDLLAGDQVLSLVGQVIGACCSERRKRREGGLGWPRTPHLQTSLAATVSPRWATKLLQNEGFKSESEMEKAIKIAQIQKGPKLLAPKNRDKIA